MSSRRHVRNCALALLVTATAAVSCGPTKEDWRLAPTREPGTVGTLDLQPSGRPATLPTVFPTTFPSDPTHAPTSLDVSIGEARQWALANNLDLKVTVYSPDIAATSISEEEARFESTFFADGRFGVTDRPSPDPVFGAGQSQSATVEPGIRIPLRTGGTVDLSSPLTRSEFASDDPQYNDALRASIAQPLLRNAGREVNEFPIRIAGYEHEISRARARLEVTRVLTAVDRVYWRLYAARRQLEVSKQQYDLAMQVLLRSQRELNVGRGIEVEVIRAQSGVADRLDEIITAENLVRARQRELKRLLNRPEIGDETTIVPATEPIPVHYSLDAMQLVNYAMLNRSELLEQELRLAQDALRIDFARNGMLPVLSATYTYRISGLGDTPADAYDMSFTRDYQDHTVGLRLDVPIGNEAARSRLRRALLQRLQQLSSKAAQSLLIRTEVLDAIDQSEAAWQRIIANRARTVLAARTLAAEERQRDAGLRTNTEVLDALTRLADAQRAEIFALTDYQIAQIDLAFATGTVLGKSRVDWETQIPKETSDKDGVGAPSLVNRK